MAGVEKASTSYPRSARISDNTLRTASLSSSRITLYLVADFISLLSFLHNEKVDCYFVLNVNLNGSAGFPLSSLKFFKFEVFIQIAYSLFGSNFTGNIFSVLFLE